MIGVVLVRRRRTRRRSRSEEHSRLDLFMIEMGFLEAERLIFVLVARSTTYQYVQIFHTHELTRACRHVHMYMYMYMYLYMYMYTRSVIFLDAWSPRFPDRLSPALYFHKSTPRALQNHTPNDRELYDSMEEGALEFRIRNPDNLNPDQRGDTVHATLDSRHTMIGHFETVGVGDMNLCSHVLACAAGIESTVLVHWCFVHVHVDVHVVWLSAVAVGYAHVAISEAVCHACLVRLCESKPRPTCHSLKCCT